MNILYVANYSPPYGGGIQFVLANLARRFIAAGHRVTILAADTGISRGHSTWEGATLIGVPASNALEKRSVPFPLFDPLTLGWALDSVLPHMDVVHIHGMLYMNCVAAAYRARRRNLRVVLTEHVGVVPYNSPVFNLAQQVAVHTLGRTSIRSSDAVVVLNERVASEIRPLVRSGATLTKIPNGVDTAIFSPPADRAALRERLGMYRPALLFAGRFAEKKGVHHVLDAALRLPEYEVIFCGQDTERLTNTPPNVRVVGKVDQHALAEWYGAADALILPSEGEGFPLVVQEALACGLPVIVTDDATNREYLDESVARFVARDGTSIERAARALFSDPAELAAMRDAARPFAVSRFDWDQTVSAYLRLYRGEVV